MRIFFPDDMYFHYLMKRFFKQLLTSETAQAIFFLYKLVYSVELRPVEKKFTEIKKNVKNVSTI